MISESKLSCILPSAQRTHVILDEVQQGGSLQWDISASNSFPRTPALWSLSCKRWDVRCICSHSQWWRGPLGLMTAPRMFYDSAQTQRSLQWWVLFQVLPVQRISLLKPWPEISASGGQELILALRASCMTLGVNAPLSSPCPPQFHWQLAIGRALPKAARSFPSCVVWDQLPTFLMLCKGMKCFRVASEYHREINEIAGIKTLAPNFQTNTS